MCGPVTQIRSNAAGHWHRASRITGGTHDTTLDDSDNADIPGGGTVCLKLGLALTAYGLWLRWSTALMLNVIPMRRNSKNELGTRFFNT
jgi:hypothetical protein